METMIRPGDRIVLTSPVKRIAVETDERVICVAAKGWGAEMATTALDDALADPPNVLAPPCVLLALGLSHLWTPSNRVALGRIFHNPRPGIRRVVVDDRMFVGEPWRLWWLLKVVDAVSAWEYTDSYRAESRWRSALDHQEPDPFRWEVVREALAGAVRGTSVPRFPPIAVEVRQVSDMELANYQVEKAAAFRDEKTLPAILRRLEAIAKRAVPDRAVPTSAAFFTTKPARIVRSEFPIDEFFVDQLIERADLTNRIAEFAEAQP
jgi:hypothetical protein